MPTNAKKRKGRKRQKLTRFEQAYVAEFGGYMEAHTVRVPRKELRPEELEQ